MRKCSRVTWKGHRWQPQRHKTAPDMKRGNIVQQVTRWLIKNIMNGTTCKNGLLSTQRAMKTTKASVWQRLWIGLKKRSKVTGLKRSTTNAAYQMLKKKMQIFKQKLMETKYAKRKREWLPRETSHSIQQQPLKTMTNKYDHTKMQATTFGT